MSHKIEINKNWLYQKYIVKKLSMDKIANLIGCGKRAIYKRLKKYNIKTRTIKEAMISLDRSGKNNAFYGKKHDEKTKMKMSKNHADFQGKNNPAYTTGLTLKTYYCKDCKEEITYQAECYGKGRCNSCTNKKENLSKETLQKRRDNHADFNGEKNGRFGLPVSEETRSKVSLSSGGTGTPYENTEYGAEFDNALKEQVRFRDGYKCKICGCSQLENGRQLDVHHLDYDKLNSVLNNLVALCKRCHMKTNYNREYWIQYFIDSNVFIV